MIKKTLLVALGLTSALSAQPQTELTRLRDTALTSDYAYQFLGHLCNEIGNRLSGSKQSEAATHYLAAEMRRLGLVVTLEPTPVPCWVRGHEGGWLTSWPGRPPGGDQPLVLTTLGGSGSTPSGGVEGEVVVVSTMNELQAKGRAAIEGKIVLFNHPFDDLQAKQGFSEVSYGQAVRYRVLGPNEASKLGARAALVRSVGGASYRLPHTGSTHFDNAPAIPALAVCAEDCERLAYLSREGPVRVRVLAQSHFESKRIGYNVIGDLPGTEMPEEIVIVSGHMDSWDVGQGALDDGCGVAMALGTAELLQRLQLRPRRTLRVIGWINEENGTAGASQYFTDHQSTLSKHVGAIESDLGCGHPTGWECLASDAVIKGLEAARMALEPMGCSWFHTVTGTGADISPLGKAGIPCFHPAVDQRTYFDYHHTSADTFDKVEPRFLRENCANMAILAYTLLQGSAAPSGRGNP